MKRSKEIPSWLIVACLSCAVATSFARAEAVLELVNEVSLEQYEAYQVSVENMGLGLYGGPAYDQGYRNRDGWRDGGTLGNQETILYLFDQFSAMGLDVFIQGRYSNVVAELPGIDTPEYIFIVCGHFDTTSNGERPGGDDNASGTAGVLEAARVLSQYSFNSTLRFIGFNAEEDWMKGSQDYVDSLPAGENILGVINLDMILRPAWDSNPAAMIDLELETADLPICYDWVDIFINTAAQYCPSLVIDPAAPHTNYWNAGDQGPFLSAGYAALLAIENTAPEVWSRGSNAYYHSSEDASDSLANDPLSPSGVTYDYEFATDVVRTTVAVLATEAAPAVPESSFDGDFDVDMADFAIFAASWLTTAGQPGWNPDCDISETADEIVDTRDLAAFAGNWLAGI